MTESLLKRGVPGIGRVLDNLAPLRQFSGFTDDGYVEAGLILANWPAIESDRAALEAGQRLTISAADTYLGPGYLPTPNDLTYLREVTPPFIEDLVVLASHRGNDRKLAIARRVIPLADQQVCFPVFDFDPRDKRAGVSVEFRCIPRSLESALAYVTALFLDNSRPYGRDLYRCRLASCGRLYLVDRSASNRPNTVYCCPEHGAEQNRIGSAERQRQRRRRLRRK